MLALYQLADSDSRYNIQRYDTRSPDNNPGYLPYGLLTTPGANVHGHLLSKADTAACIHCRTRCTDMLNFILQACHCFRQFRSLKVRMLP